MQKYTDPLHKPAKIFIFLLSFFFLLFFSSQSFAAVYTVTNCKDDTNPGSLRWALNSAAAVGDVIAFDITYASSGYSTGDAYPGLVTNEASDGGKWFRIVANSSLNIKANNIYINGTSQTREADNKGRPNIEIRGTSGGSYGFLLDGQDNCTIEGLIVGKFYSGIEMENHSDNNTIKGCYIGVTGSGKGSISNSYGVYLSSSSNNRITGGNVISGNGYGIYLSNSATNEISGNYIGTDKDGKTSIPNNYGIRGYSSSNNKIIGGNVISGNKYYGVFLYDEDANEIMGNYIGISSDETTPLGNSMSGIYLYSNISNNIIASNVIAYNGYHDGSDGVKLEGAKVFSVKLSQNKIYNNYNQGISLASGANRGISPPVIVNKNYNNGTLTVSGTGTPEGIVEIFEADNGQSKRYLGSAEVQADGTWTFSKSDAGLGSNYSLTATQTDKLGDTSEEYKENQGPSNLTVTNCNDSGPGSLRYALGSAKDGDTILFDITTKDGTVGYSTGEVYPGLATKEANDGGRWFRIVANSSLNIKANNIYINGTSQTKEADNKGRPNIEIRGTSGGSYGFLLDGQDNCTIEGLIVGKFYSGIEMENNSDNNTIKGCYIGVTGSGKGSISNSYGVYLSSSSNNRITGGNVISGNGYGIYLSNSATNEISGNYIGTDKDGKTSIPNNYGIRGYSSSNNKIIGGNVISGNKYYGVFLYDEDANEIMGNYIGISSDETTPLGNSMSGIYLYSNISNNIIASNVIAYNGYHDGSDGVKLEGAKVFSVKLSQNKIYNNYNQGISLASGANRGISPPVIVNKNYNNGVLTVSGTGTPEGIVEIFEADNGQSKRYLGSAEVQADGTWTFSKSDAGLGSNYSLTATQTDKLGDTSEEYKENQGPSNLTVTNCNDSGPGSLRYALGSAKDGDTILFDITTKDGTVGYSTGEVYPGLATKEANDGGRWFRIVANSSLNVKANNIYINGTSQTREADNKGRPNVEIRGIGQNYNGFEINSYDNCTIEGLIIGGFYGGIYAYSQSDNNTIKGCYIGATGSGEGSIPNSNGVIFNS